MNIENTNNLRSCTSCKEQYAKNEALSCSLTKREKWGLKEYPLASVYAPLQEFRNLYRAEEGIRHGTIFKELDLPFMGK